MPLGNYQGSELLANMQMFLYTAELRHVPNSFRLQMLEQQVVGGEQAKNKDLKEKHKRRKKYADERKRQLVAALQNSDEDSTDWVLLNVYDSIQEEVQAKSKLLEKMQKKVTTWKQLCCTGLGSV